MCVSYRAVYLLYSWFFGCHYGNVTVKLIFHVKQFILLRHFRGIPFTISFPRKYLDARDVLARNFWIFEFLFNKSSFMFRFLSWGLFAFEVTDSFWSINQKGTWNKMITSSRAYTSLLVVSDVMYARQELQLSDKETLYKFIEKWFLSHLFSLTQSH